MPCTTSYQQTLCEHTRNEQKRVNWVVTEQVSTGKSKNITYPDNQQKPFSKQQRILRDKDPWRQWLQLAQQFHCTQLKNRLVRMVTTQNIKLVCKIMHYSVPASREPHNIVKTDVV